MSEPKRYDVGMKEERCDKTGFCTSLPWVYPSDDGKYVLHADYAALKAENERLKTERDHYQWASINDGIACNERARENQDLENQIDALKAENERLKDELIGYHKECDRLYEQAIDQQMAANVFENNGIILKAENERLRKAGDEMARVAIPSYILDTKVKAIEGWNAAKGVKP